MSNELLLVFTRVVVAQGEVEQLAELRVVVEDRTLLPGSHNIVGLLKRGGERHDLPFAENGRFFNPACSPCGGRVSQPPPP